MPKNKYADHTRPAGETEWEVVLGLIWTPKNRKVLEKIKAAGPEGLSYEAAGSHWYSRYMSINNGLRHAKLDLRLSHAGPRQRGRSFEKERWYLFHVSEAAGA